MENLVESATALIAYIKWGGVFDTVDDDGDGYTDHSQSHKLQELVDDLQSAIDDSAPTMAAVKIIKESFITIVQTAIARQTE